MKSAFRINSPPGSSGIQTIPFYPLLGHPGVVQQLVLDVTLGLKNNAAATSAIKVRSGNGASTATDQTTAAAAFPTGAFPEQTVVAGNDDIDNLLIALFGTVPWILNAGVGRILFDQYNAVQLRTLCGALNNGRDLVSRNLIDYPIIFPATASGFQTYSFQLCIPISLADYIRGGECFAQGTDSLRDGSLTIPLLAPASFVNVAGATINTNNIQITLFADYLWEGDGSWVGPTYRASRQIYGGNTVALKPSHYLWVSDSSTQSAATVGGAGFNACPVTQYNGHGQWNFDQLSPQFLRADWGLTRNQRSNFYDVGERTVPLITMDPTDAFNRLPVAPMSQTVDASSGGPANTTLMVVEGVPTNPGIVSQVAAMQGGGGATTMVHPHIDSVSEGYHESHIAFAPSIRTAGALPGGKVLGSPVAAGNKAAQQVTTGQATALQRRK
jgi:hypothetical protein